MESIVQRLETTAVDTKAYAESIEAAMKADFHKLETRVSNDFGEMNKQAEASKTTHITAVTDKTHRHDLSLLRLLGCSCFSRRHTTSWKNPFDPSARP